jgi:hypothetical protein
MRHVPARDQVAVDDLGENSRLARNDEAIVLGPVILKNIFAEKNSDTILAFLNQNTGG